MVVTTSIKKEQPFGIFNNVQVVAVLNITNEKVITLTATKIPWTVTVVEDEVPQNANTLIYMALINN